MQFTHHSSPAQEVEKQQAQTTKIQEKVAVHSAVTTDYLPQSSKASNSAPTRNSPSREQRMQARRQQMAEEEAARTQSQPPEAAAAESDTEMSAFQARRLEMFGDCTSVRTQSASTNQLTHQEAGDVTCPPGLTELSAASADWLTPTGSERSCSPFEEVTNEENVHSAGLPGKQQRLDESNESDNGG